MAKLIKCECGYVARGETNDDVVALLEGHIREAHPDLAGKVARDEMFALIEEG